MTDIYDKSIRSYTMSQVKGKDTKPELLVRRALFAQGFRFRKNDRRYPGHPDIVLPKYKTVVFVNGCFWHGHELCRGSHLPESNVEYWKNKIGRNIERDRKNYEALKEAGWKVIVVWECELKRHLYEERISLLVKQIVDD